MEEEVDALFVLHDKRLFKFWEIMMKVGELIVCPEQIDLIGTECGALAEITRVSVLDSTDGPIAHIGILCMNEHVLFMPENDLWPS